MGEFMPTFDCRATLCGMAVEQDASIESFVVESVGKPYLSMDTASPYRTRQS